MFALLSDEELKEAYGDYRESIGREEEKRNTLLKSIRNIMDDFNVSAERAMDTLKIPQEKRSMFLEKINQENAEN